VKDLGKKNVLGVLVDAIDYEAAVDRIIDAAKGPRPLSASALAVHGVMTGVSDRTHRYRLNHMDLITPDGQPVRWALNLLHGARLSDRVYGPDLMLEVCAAAATERLPIYLYGSRDEILEPLERNLLLRFPGLEIAGREPSKFRTTDKREKEEIVDRIRRSGAQITFVGLGCPRQEVFVYEYGAQLGMPTIAVGAAFDYHAGALEKPPRFVQRWGLQWAHRLIQEPRRLWKRYLITNSSYMTLLALQAVRLHDPDPGRSRAPDEEMLYG
jgi:exopolysaccharide biosynthesis WecB/TagA/CpsF family protein